MLATEVGDATSAAPGYFPAVQIGEDWFLDGGVVCNNPTIVSLDLQRENKHLVVLMLYALVGLC